MTPAFRSLRVRNYRLFASGQVISNTGTWMQRVAQDWLVLDLTHSGTALGIVTGLQFAPMLLLSLWGGVVADRYAKRKLLMVTQTAMGLLALALGVLVLTGTVRIWHAYLLAVALGVVTALDNPTRQAFVVEMVGKRDLPNAVSLNSATFNLARIVGPAVGGVGISWVGTGWIFLINAASYVAVLVSLARMRESELNLLPPLPREPGQLREGLRYVLRRPNLLLPIMLVFFVGTFGLNFQMTNALFATHVFHRGPGAYGLLNTALAVGAFTGAMLAARRVRVRQRVMVIAAFGFGLAELAAAFTPTYLSYMALLVPLGLAYLTLNTAANATVQLGAAPEMRGRVMGLYMLVFMGGVPVGAPLIGWLSQTFGPRWSLVLGGAASATATLVATGLLARRGVMTSEPRARSVEPAAPPGPESAAAGLTLLASPGRGDASAVESEVGQPTARIQRGRAAVEPATGSRPTDA